MVEADLTLPLIWIYFSFQFSLLTFTPDKSQKTLVFIRFLLKVLSGQLAVVKALEAGVNCIEYVLGKNL